MNIVNNDGALSGKRRTMLSTDMYGKGTFYLSMSFCELSGRERHWQFPIMLGGPWWNTRLLKQSIFKDFKEKLCKRGEVGKLCRAQLPNSSVTPRWSPGVGIRGTSWELVFTSAKQKKDLGVCYGYSHNGIFRKSHRLTPCFLLGILLWLTLAWRMVDPRGSMLDLRQSRRLKPIGNSNPIMPPKTHVILLDLREYLRECGANCCFWTPEILSGSLHSPQKKVNQSPLRTQTCSACPSFRDGESHSGGTSPCCPILGQVQACVISGSLPLCGLGCQSGNCPQHFGWMTHMHLGWLP